MKRNIFLVIFIIAVAAMTFCAVKGGGKPAAIGPERTKEAKELKDLEQKVTSFNIDGRTSKGVKQWHLEGNTAEMIDGEIHFNDLKAVAYGEEVTVNLSSNKGIYRKDRGEVILIGNVQVDSDDGSRLTTEEAKWSQKTREISSDLAIRIERESMVATGIGGTANSAERTATLKKNVKVDIEPHTKVTSDGPLTVRHGENVAIFSDNVKVKDKDGVLLADKLTVNFNPETRELAEVVAEGNVKIKRGKSYTISDKAVYTESTKSAKLTGNPRIIIDPEEIEELGRI
ncbi:MAG: LPS export ABC transporter periplasmic protein LptC [Candidatus Omnitrophota bacterium]